MDHRNDVSRQFIDDTVLIGGRFVEGEWCHHVPFKELKNQPLGLV